MSAQSLSLDQQQLLLRLARTSLEQAARGQKLPRVDLNSYPAELVELGACFVTLTAHGHLRGCIGTLEAYQPFVLDVIEHAAAAGINDYRFEPVKPHELADIHIEISRLTPAQKLEYSDQVDLISKLRPGIDGVILIDGRRRATFLPQVWEQINDVREFLDHLCYKMGAQPDLWRKKKLDVLIYQVEEFHE